MLGKSYTAAILGVNAKTIEIEVDVSPGLPSFAVVGLPDAAVQEARERVRAAIKNSGYAFPAARVTVNLAPADIRKEGSGFDLPVALALLVTQGVVAQEHLNTLLIAGELALDGAVRPISGAINMALAALEQKRALMVPNENGDEAAAIENVAVFTPSSLREAVQHLSGQTHLAQRSVPIFRPEPESLLCLSDIKGQAQAKRALEVGLAGNHNLIFVGPPGSGKTMLARRAVGLRPPLTQAEALEVTRIYSSAGKMPRGLIQEPPFRAPHHTVSDAGLIGGGSVPKPGEVSLAHHGILFLDEFPEFSTKALETLRQPLEDAVVTISRARAQVTYPARFQLIAAMNPSRSGDWVDKNNPEQRRYLSRLSGPLLDRIDLIVNVPKLSAQELTNAPVGEASSILRARIHAARGLALTRQGCNNAQLSGKALRQHAPLEAGPERFMLAASKRLDLSGRGYDRVLRVARTIADLAQTNNIQEPHLAEAVAYRARDW